MEARLSIVKRFPDILMVRYLGPILAVATVMTGTAGLMTGTAGPMTGIASAEPLRLDLVKVDAGGEVGGPEYDFRIDRFEIRNDDFVTFLNDALANFDNERGHYLYIDNDTGDVYVNTDELGETGIGANERAILMFSPAAAGQIEFVGGSYRIVSDAVDYATHPVTGVSWYGAVKFCNWLTIQVGIDPDQRCYTEAAADDPHGWHPVTITDIGWSLRDLTDEERETLATEFLGYRLPMDHGAEVTAAFNEWYKAAAYDPAAPDVVRTPPFGPEVAPDHWIFGFGRDVIESVDANFLGSGDPFDGFDPASTPVGFFDGINLLTDLTLTSDTDNPYGLYDLSGNVWEWMQDRGDSLDQRRHRGGGWDLTEAFVENTFVSGNLADATPNWVGFRVVQAELALDPIVEPDDTVVMQFTGPAGGPFAPLSIEYTIRSLSADPLDWEVTSDATWLDLDGMLSAAGTLEPFATVTIVAAAGPTAEDLTVGTHTATLSFLADGVSIATRQLDLEASGLFVDVLPTTGLVSSGPAGGPFFPDTKTYTLSNTSEQQLPWQVTSDASWVLINGGTSDIGSLAPGLDAEVNISISTPELVQLPINQLHTAVILFEDVASGASTTRSVVVGVGLSPLTIEMAIVEGDDPQPGGPTHSFRIGVNEITNREFLGFLNDAFIFRGLSRGHWMYHDIDSGDVYINSSQDGVVGPDGTGTLIFDASISGRIEFDGTQYRAAGGAEQEPVVGVTWYGAVKFCNWLTLLQGIDAAQLAYTEGPLPEDWHPVTIAPADWLLRDLSDLERADLVANHFGFRLPMDGGLGGADPYNEWYKAAAWTHETGGTELIGNTLNSSSDGLSSCDLEVDPRDVWWTYTPDEDGTLTLDLSFDPTNIHLFSVHTGCPASVCNDIACHADGPIALEVEAELTYWIRVATRGAAAGPFTLTINGPGCTDGVAGQVDDCLTARPVCPGELGINRLYGFGRDILDSEDANFWDSGDTEENNLTPVGWFDGVNVLADDETATRASQNAYRLFDICGNASEWMQDHGGIATTRATRGGSWQTIGESPILDNLTRAEDAPNAARAFTGFRIVQSQAGISIQVTPDTNVAASGPVGGPFVVDAGSLTYTMQVPGAALTSEYDVSTGADWLTLNGEGQSVRGVIEPPLPGQPELTVDVAISFNEDTNVLGAPPDPIFEMAIVPAGDAQPDGPMYSYRIALHETTNEAFVEFLNDAMANLENDRGQFLYFDLDTGDVFVNTQQTGETGPGDGGRTLRVFNSFVNTRLTYDSLENEFVVTPGFERHPVTGVSWFGALKYCNWLTVKDGLGTSQRAYEEGSQAGDWHPVTISTCDWWGTDDTEGVLVPLPEARDLSDDERLDLVNGFRGYRLAMDGGFAAENPYNEWFKAAAWDAALSVNHVFGFGRDGPLLGAEANFDLSGDPFESGTTPVGLFDGTRYNEGGGGDIGDGTDFQTLAETNPYGLFDMSGNVEEWVQDRGDPATQQATRGGHWQDDGASTALETTGRRSVAGGDTRVNVGFRIVQSGLDFRATVTFDDVTAGSSTTRELRLLLHEPLHIDDPDGLDASGMFAGPFTDDGKIYTLTSESVTPMDWQVTVSQDGSRWLDINGSESDSGQVTDELEAAVDVRTNAASLTLPPGSYTATLLIENQTTGHQDTREMTLEIEEPLNVAPETWDIEMVWQVPLDPPLSTVFEMSNVSATEVSYTVTSSTEWFVLEDEEPISGQLEPFDLNQQTIRVTVETNDAADDLEIGLHEATITFRNDSAGSVVTRAVNLNVRDPLRVDPEAATEGDPSFEWRGPVGGPFASTTGAVSVENVGSITVFYDVSVEDNTWLDLGGETLLSNSLFPGASTAIPLSLTALADALGAGQYSLDVTFDNLTSQFVQTHIARLVVEGDLSVTPATDITTAGREGGPVHSSPTVYTLRNVGGGGVMNWTASSDPPVTWITIDGQSSVGGSLDVGESANVTVDIDNVAAAALSAGTHEADVLFDSGTGQQVRRHMRLDLATAIVSADDRSVPPTQTQPGGPAYLYRMSRMPTTNAEFAAFLNDARASLDNDRGRYMFFDLDSGDVYVSDTMTGRDGTEAPNTTITTRMYNADVGRIVLLNDSFQVETGYEVHPVVGVSWYGAVKYANWLTLDQGFVVGDRCYTESDAADLDGWHPVSVSTANWAGRPMIDAERTTLVDDCRGYRLPMDHQAAQASLFNEWYKAAAWDPAGNGGLGINRLYGFGRDTITSADANFQCSGDIFEDASDCMIGGTTPAGHFDGVSLLADGTPTSAGANGFGFLGMTGNVLHWMQGRFSESNNILGNRTLRGGGWDSPASSPLLQASGRTHTPADQTHRLIGFRVLRTLLPADGDANQDGTVDQTDFGVMALVLDGPGEGILPDEAVFDFNGDGDIDMGDFATFQVAFDGQP